MGDGLADGLVTALFKLRLWLICSRHVGDHDNRHAGILRPRQTSVHDLLHFNDIFGGADSLKSYPSRLSASLRSSILYGHGFLAPRTIDTMMILLECGRHAWGMAAQLL
jgi:hypothetical protein